MYLYSGGVFGTPYLKSESEMGKEKTERESGGVLSEIGIILNFGNLISTSMRFRIRGNA